MAGSIGEHSVRAGRLAARLALLGCLLGPAPGLRATESTVQPMVDAMTRMMDAFGMIDRYRWNTTPPAGTARQDAWPQGPYPGTGYDGWSGAPQPAPAGQASPLEGVWQGNNGGVLVVQQGQARLYAAREQYQDFQLRLQDQLLLLREPHSGQVRSYEFALQGDRLALRDRAGNLVLFRRAALPQR